MKIRCKEVREVGWEKAIRQAEDFCASIGDERIVSVSHVEESPYGVIFIWYREG